MRKSTMGLAALAVAAASALFLSACTSNTSDEAAETTETATEPSGEAIVVYSGRNEELVLSLIHI